MLDNVSGIAAVPFLAVLALVQSFETQFLFTMM